MAADKIMCRDCNLCDIEGKTCKLTGRPITLDSLRNCKKGVKRTLIEQSTNN